MVEVVEVLRAWLGGAGLRRAAERAGVDRKTARRYVEAARAAGLERGPEAEVGDELVAEVVSRVRPGRPAARGASWADLEARHGQIQEWVDGRPAERDEAGVVVEEARRPLSAVKIRELLARQGCAVPYRTVHRYLVERCGFRAPKATVRVDDGEPGEELQVDFGYMGMLLDPGTGRRRKVHALVLTACVSRFQYVRLSFSQTLADVVAGCEEAWAYFGGVFKVVVPDNLTPVVKDADPVNPVYQAGWLDYAQHCGFATDPARVKSPTDKPRVERQIQYVRGSMWDGEAFADLEDARRRCREWCDKANQRVHGTTRAVPAEEFARREAPGLLPVPEVYDPPVFADVKVHRDLHVQVCKALYSAPAHLVGRTLQARADSKLVRLYRRGQLVKVHPRQPPGGRRTDREDMPAEKTAYAMRDVDSLKRRAAEAGRNVGVYAERLLDSDLPWTRMRSVYRLLGLAERYGADAVDQACATSLELEVVAVGKIDAMCRKAVEARKPDLPAGGASGGRFARETGEFKMRGGVQLSLIRGGKDDEIEINKEML